MLPRFEAIQLALTQFADGGHLEAQPDTARIASITDFDRARFLCRLSHTQWRSFDKIRSG